MLLNDAVVIINNKNELGEKVDLLLSDSKAQDALANNAMHFIQSKNGIINKYMEHLDPYLKPLSKMVL